MHQVAEGVHLHPVQLGEGLVKAVDFDFVAGGACSEHLEQQVFGADGNATGLFVLEECRDLQELG